MTSGETKIIRELLSLQTGVLDGIRRLCRREPDTTPADVRELLAHVEEELGLLIQVVQTRLQADWTARHPTVAPFPRRPSVTSADLQQGVPVPRYDVAGNLVDAPPPEPVRTGTWATRMPMWKPRQRRERAATGT